MPDPLSHARITKRPLPDENRPKETIHYGKWPICHQPAPQAPVCAGSARPHGRIGFVCIVL